MGIWGGWEAPWLTRVVGAIERDEVEKVKKEYEEAANALSEDGQEEESEKEAEKRRKKGRKKGEAVKKKMEEMKKKGKEKKDTKKVALRGKTRE